MSNPNPELYTIFCVLDVDPGTPFRVKIPPSETLADLQELIAEARPDLLKTIVPATLQLYRMDIEATTKRGKLKETMDKLAEEELVSPALVLSRLYPSPPPKNTIHLAVLLPVQAPLQSFAVNEALKRKHQDSEQFDTPSKRLRADHDIAVQNALQKSRPSKGSNPSTLISEQKKKPILNGRPYTTLGPPIILYEKAFLDFRRAMNEKKAGTPLPLEIYNNARNFLVASAEIYRLESHRRAGVINLLKELLGRNIKLEQNDDQSSSDGLITIDITLAQCALLLLLEIKNEVGSGHSDPSIQAALSFTRYWSQDKVSMCRDRTLCPSFLLSISGPWVSVHGGILLGQDWIVQPLTNFIWTGGKSDFEVDDQVASVAYLFHHLGKGVTTLEERYKELVKMVEPPLARFPHIVSYCEGDNSVQITYKERLHSSEYRKTTSIFLATDQEGNFLFIKFTPHYNARAHRLLAQHGYAPQLIHCSEFIDNCFFMVVMEYIPGESMAECAFTQDDLERVQKAKDLLHENNYVFGDLRANNIVKPKTGSGVMLVDFDWCEVEGKGRYPLTINQDRACGWHSEVVPGAIMRKEHDNHLFNLLKGDVLLL